MASKPLLVANDQYLPILLKLLSGAREKIDVVAFSFAIGSGSRKPSASSAPLQVAQKLIQLKKKYGSKLQIRLYIEGRRETADRNRVTAEFLKKHGIKIKYGSTHAKGFCVDDRYVLFGSTNLTNQSMTKNNETNLLFSEAAAVEGFENYFNHLWTGGKHGGITLDPPMLADGAFKDSLIEMIDAAKSRIEFSIYFFHHTEIENALKRAAKRGVKITGFFHNHASFAMSYVLRTRATAERLRKSGISDIHYGPAHLFTHSKYLIRDRKEILLGTGNWLQQDVKVHPQLYIRLMNPVLAREMAKLLARQIKGS